MRALAPPGSPPRCPRRPRWRPAGRRRPRRWCSPRPTTPGGRRLRARLLPALPVLRGRRDSGVGLVVGRGVEPVPGPSASSVSVTASRAETEVEPVWRVAARSKEAAALLRGRISAARAASSRSSSVRLNCCVSSWALRIYRSASWAATLLIIPPSAERPGAVRVGPWLRGRPPVNSGAAPWRDIAVQLHRPRGRRLARVLQPVNAQEFLSVPGRSPSWTTTTALSTRWWATSSSWVPRPPWCATTTSTSRRHRAGR